MATKKDVARPCGRPTYPLHVYTSRKTRDSLPWVFILTDKDGPPRYERWAACHGMEVTLLDGVWAGKLDTDEGKSWLEEGVAYEGKDMLEVMRTLEVLAKLESA